MKKISILILVISNLAFSQIGGNTSFNNLNSNYNARNLGLGNFVITSKDSDPNKGINNPALLNSTMNEKFSFNHLFQTGSVQTGMINYTRKNMLLNSSQSISLRYVDYGKMQETSENGEIIGSFTPADFIISSGIGKTINEHLSFGIQCNLLYSQYDKYVALGGSFDFGGNYIFKDTTQNISFLLKNIGYQFKSFTPNTKASLPTELQIAYSHKLKHAPFRLSYLFHHLNKWNLSYFDPTVKGTTDPLTGDSVLPKQASFIQKTAMHFTPQVELLIGKNIHIRMAFDYFRRYQMSLTNRPGISGFSFGIGMYFKRFTLDYGFSSYSAAGNINGITFTSSISQWRKKTNL